jgi:hypothetical protein
VVGLRPIDAARDRQPNLPVSRLPSLRAWAGACSAPIEGLDGPTSDEQFMTPAHRTDFSLRTELGGSPCTAIRSQALLSPFVADRYVTSGSAPASFDGSDSRKYRMPLSVR